MQKEQRQTALLKLITANQIARQEELAEMLEKKGFSVTQSSVSRDLLELGIIKSSGFYALPSKPKSEMVYGLVSLEIAGESLVVAKTESGFAAAVCVKIDNERMPEIVGTIAGEDTIFLAVRGQKEQKTVLKKVWELFES
jgi:transcriptional regulator of arginine metabolism